MRFYSVTYKIYENDNNVNVDSFDRCVVETNNKPADECTEFQDYDLYVRYFDTQEEQLEFILDEIKKWK